MRSDNKKNRTIRKQKLFLKCRTRLRRRGRHVPEYLRNEMTQFAGQIISINHLCVLRFDELKIFLFIFFFGERYLPRADGFPRSAGYGTMLCTYVASQRRDIPNSALPKSFDISGFCELKHLLHRFLNPLDVKKWPKENSKTGGLLKSKTPTRPPPPVVIYVLLRGVGYYSVGCGTTKIVWRTPGGGVSERRFIGVIFCYRKDRASRRLRLIYVFH